MAKIEKSGAVIRRLRNLAAKKSSASVVVGYTQHYAVYVHENLQANHPNGGEAKFLEKPARSMRAQLGIQVRSDLKNGLSVEQALLRAGLSLQRASQQIVPVDTGALRSSAFTSIERK